MPKKDYITEIVEYKQRNLKKGYTKESLKWALIQQGYSKLEVEKALIKVDQILAAKAPVLNIKPVIKYEVIPVVEKKKSFWKRLFG